MQKVESQWRHDTPPTDGTCFIADVGMAWAVFAIWNEADGKYVHANVQVNMVNGEWNDTYFDNEQCWPDEIRAWMPLPECEARKNK